MEFWLAIASFLVAVASFGYAIHLHITSSRELGQARDKLLDETKALRKHTKLVLAMIKDNDLKVIYDDKGNPDHLEKRIEIPAGSQKVKGHAPKVTIGPAKPMNGDEA